ncbi:MAG: PDDEXK nuclease domain-containing protein [Methanoregula sp.]|jgi:predicted nuclease of restriction endonuclease-like (RecB) superfamily
MAGKAVKAKSPAPDEPILPLVQEIRDLVQGARRAAAQSVNTLQVVTNFEIGRRIVEFEQKGNRRAEYGERIVRELSQRLTAELGRGFSKRNLEYIRRFYLEYHDATPQIAQTLSAQLPAKTTTETPIGQTLSAQFKPSFSLSWSHYIVLMNIDNRDERRFYEIESRENQWSLSELKRQFNSGIYERLALSRDKKGVKSLADKGQIIGNPQDMLKDPYVLEFLGLDENAHYSESDLESAIIDKLETFLLELGKGFLFEARQKRFTFDADHYFVDLVFYNRLLRCYVLIDLKIGKITHENLGQMQMYVNYYDREVKLPDENPTVGIILCRTKNDALVRLTLPEKSNIYASQYQLYLPSKEELKQKLIEWSKSVPDPSEPASP